MGTTPTPAPAGKIRITFDEEGNPYGPASFEIPAEKSAKLQRFVEETDPTGALYQGSKAMLFLRHNQIGLLDVIDKTYPDPVPPAAQELIDQAEAIKAQTRVPMIVLLPPGTLAEPSTLDAPPAPAE
jgi:hypothetical protein